MLRIIENSNAGRAKSYYTAPSMADYYSEGQELAGTWHGKAAARLGLAGTIDKADWDALCDNRQPRTGQTLTARNKANRRLGWDFNWHVPKSVSVLYGLTNDSRILEAFKASVDQTMQDIEADAKTRMRRRGKNEDGLTANLVWGTFVHQTARPIDGIPDPHLHAHCFVANATFTEAENCWKAVQIGDIKRDGQFYESLFHARMARRLAELGLPIERTRHGYEIAGFSKPLLEKFSRRTAQIEARAKEEGIDTAAGKSELGARTRERKQKDLSMPELRREWASRLLADEAETISAIGRNVGLAPSKKRPECAREATALAVEHLFERKAVVPERQVMVEAMKRSYGQGSVEDVRQAVAEQNLIMGEIKGRRMATTASALGDETAMIRFARDGQGSCAPLVRGPHKFQRDWLNSEQRTAVEHVLYSHDRVVIVRGQAGTGKTTLMKEAAEAIEAEGIKVFAFAPSADASRGTLRQEGFADAETVAMLLSSEKLQQAAQSQVLWIDEAGLIGTRTMAQIFAVAYRLNARVILQGDIAQHGSVERGAALRLLQSDAGLAPVELKTIQRQRGQYRDAVRLFSEGRTEEGFKALDRLGWIREIPDAERYSLLAKDYVTSVARGKSTLIVSPTHREADRINDAVRVELRQARLLGREQRHFHILENANLTVAQRRDPLNLSDGDVLEYHQNARGHLKGERITVGTRPLPLSDAERFTAYRVHSLALSPGDTLRITKNGSTLGGRRLNNGSIVQVKGFTQTGDIRLTNGSTIRQDWGHWTYGYVQTSHAAQGRTVDVLLLAQSTDSFPASSREQLYVSVSRARKKATLYTSDKKALLEAVCQSDERLSASELVRDRDHDERAQVVARQAALEPAMIGEHRPRESYVEHDR